MESFWMPNPNRAPAVTPRTVAATEIWFGEMGVWTSQRERSWRPTGRLKNRSTVPSEELESDAQRASPAAAAEYRSWTGGIARGLVDAAGGERGSVGGCQSSGAFGQLADVGGEKQLSGAGNHCPGAELWELGNDVKRDAEGAGPAKVRKRAGGHDRDGRASTAMGGDDEPVEQGQGNHGQSGGAGVGKQDGGNSMTGSIHSGTRCEISVSGGKLQGELPEPSPQFPEI